MALELEYTYVDDTLTINEVWVSIDQRRKGIARQAILDLVEELKPNKVVAKLVMPLALPFWYRMGFLTDKDNKHNMILCP